MKKRIVWCAFLLFWIGIIFHISSQTSQVQDLSGVIEKVVDEEKWGEMLSGFSVRYYDQEISVEKSGVIDFIHFLIRKGAHVGIFFVLGLLTIVVWRLFTDLHFISVFGSLLFVFGYACLDELHQHYTGGRTPLFDDVILDTIGGVFGIVCYLAFTRFRKKEIML
ncbi:VanZ family protein [Bacillus sp. JJ634]